MLSDETSEILAKIYNTPNHGASFSSAEKIKYELLKTYDIYASEQDIQDWLDRNLTYNLHKRAVYTFKRNPIIVSYIDEQWQIDLMFFPDIKNNYNGCLICIDIASRYLWAEAIRNKSGKEVTEAMRRILIRAHPRKPLKIQADEGTEFYNKNFKGLLSEYGIETLFSVHSDHKAAIIERTIRTFKDKLYRILDSNPSLQSNWNDLIQDIVDSYNDTYHTNIKTKPKYVNTKTIGQVLWNLHGEHWVKDKKPKPAKFKIGDYVRISTKKHPFHKGYKHKWQEELFKISKIRYGVENNTYEITNYYGKENIKGIFYPHELTKEHDPNPTFRIEKILKTRTKNGKKESLIRWSGYPSEYDSWEQDSSIKDLPNLSHVAPSKKKK